MDYDEEYIVTFPNGYGRSILTVPWIELGGPVTISCPKTGYNCNIEFLTKPFYGNKKHKITADVYAPDDKKPFLSIAGEWNGVMEAKYNEKVSGRAKLFWQKNFENIKILFPGSRAVCRCEQYANSTETSAKDS